MGVQGGLCRCLREENMFVCMHLNGRRWYTGWTAGMGWEPRVGWGRGAWRCMGSSQAQNEQETIKTIQIACQEQRFRFDCLVLLQSTVILGFVCVTTSCKHTHWKNKTKWNNVHGEFPAPLQTIRKHEHYASAIKRKQERKCKKYIEVIKHWYGWAEEDIKSILFCFGLVWFEAYLPSLEAKKSDLHMILNHCKPKAVALNSRLFGSNTQVSLTSYPARAQNTRVKIRFGVAFFREVGAFFGLEIWYPLLWIHGHGCWCVCSNPHGQLQCSGLLCAPLSVWEHSPIQELAPRADDSLFSKVETEPWHLETLKVFWLQL